MPGSYTQVSALTEKHFMPKVHDQIFDSNIVARRLKKGGRYKKTPGGTSIVIPLNYAMASASAWYQGSEDLNITDNDVICAGQVEWAQLHAAVVISGLDRLINAGPQQVLSFVQQKIEIAKKTMMDKLGTGIFSDGTDSKSIVGLRDWVATDQTVAGLSQTTNTWWAGQVDSTTTTFGLSALQTGYTLCCIDNMKPTLGVCTRAILNRLWGALQPQQRFTDSETASAGFSNIMFNQVPVVFDSYCPANHFFFLNEDNLGLHYHPERDIKMMPFADVVGNDVQVAQIYWMGAFASYNNRTHFKASALSA
jgi:hypothetical protein